MKLVFGHTAEIYIYCLIAKTVVVVLRARIANPRQGGYEICSFGSWNKYSKLFSSLPHDAIVRQLRGTPLINRSPKIY
jgi:hypothetical protein